MTNKLAGRIEELRKKRGDLSQAQLAETLGLSEPKTRGRSMVNNWEQGTPIKSDMVFKICETYDVSPAWLFGYSDEPSSKEDIQITHKTTGLSEKAIQNIKRCDSRILLRLIESELFVEMLEDVYYLESSLSGVEEIEEQVASNVPADEYTAFNQQINDGLKTSNRPDIPPEYYAWAQFVSHLRDLCETVRLKKYDLSESFLYLIEEIVPSRKILEMAKKTLKERGAWFGRREE